jgi:hypothetical protein
MFIVQCEHFSKRVLETDALLHDFQNLEELLVAFCDSLTKKGIDLLMSDKNSIKEMTLLFNHTHSELLTAENMNEWKEKSKQKNWELKLDFLCY